MSLCGSSGGDGQRAGAHLLPLIFHSPHQAHLCILPLISPFAHQDKPSIHPPDLNLPFFSPTTQGIRTLLYPAPLASRYCAIT